MMTDCDILRTLVGAHTSFSGKAAPKELKKSDCWP